MNRGSHRYSVYGVEVTSDWPLAFPPSRRAGGIAEVDLVDGTDDDFSEADALRLDQEETWFTSHLFPDRSAYIRWSGLYEFRVHADGSRVACRPLERGDRTVLQNFLFGQALSFALVFQGFEPLHAAAVQVDEAAIGFLGDCRYGKSTLLASFLQAGHQLVTDDLLMLVGRDQQTVALPGTGRIKLHPDSARTFLAGDTAGEPLNSQTLKRSFPLPSGQVQRTALPLTHLFVLPTPEERDGATSIQIVPLSRAEMVRELLKNSFNIEILDRDRLARQFPFVTGIASAIQGSRLSYPSGLHHLPAVHNRILDHLRRGFATDGVCSQPSS